MITRDTIGSLGFKLVQAASIVEQAQKLNLGNKPEADIKKKLKEAEYKIKQALEECNKLFE